MPRGPVSELLDRASERTDVQPLDGKSMSRFERLTVDGERLFLKRVSWSTDWVMRSSGDRTYRPYVVWRAGVLGRVPPSIDHAVVAMELSGEGGDAELSILMRDVEGLMVPEGDAVVPGAQHAAFIEHMAELAAAFWGFDESLAGLSTMAQRLRLFDGTNIAREMRVESPPGAIVAADQGWRALPARSPLLAATARAIHDDPSQLSAALAATPVTLLHGDWKMGNIGSHLDGRTILVDWAFPGAGPPCWDLCWYLALNRARLPEPKEATIARFRGALEGLGIPTAGWFDTQLDLCLVGVMATFGWEKALGDEDELRWWEAQVASASARQALG